MGKKLTKKNKGWDTLSKVSGLSTNDVKGIWKSVKENHALLNSCSFHIFTPHPSPNMSRRYVCDNCKGTVGSLEKVWYEQGIEHSQAKKKGDYNVL